MEPFTGAILTALWLGILTSISPCPLATNIAAISYIGNKYKSPGQLISTGLLYTFGRMLAYFLIAILVLTSLLSIPDVGRFLQKYINLLIGPMLLFVGLMMLNIIRINLFLSGKYLEKMQKKSERSGVFGAFILGLIFALALCPLAAGIFFGSLIPLSIQHNSRIILPLAYGLGTALPVLGISLILGFGVMELGKLFRHITLFELWAKRITGIVFIGIGMYLIYIYIVRIYFL
jgi:cytochrome c biogenesis protein CcdA